MEFLGKQQWTRGELTARSETLQGKLVDLLGCQLKVKHNSQNIEISSSEGRVTSNHNVILREFV